MRIHHLVAFTLLTACGSNESDNKDAAPAMQSLALDTEADLPACDAAREHQLAYLIDTKVFMTCRGGGWVDMSAPPVDLTEAWTCPESSNLSDAADTDIRGMTAQVALFSNGTAFISCYDGHWNDSLRDSNSGHRMYGRNSTAMTNGRLFCGGKYTTFIFDVAATTGLWTSVADTTKTAAVTCTKEEI